MNQQVHIHLCNPPKQRHLLDVIKLAIQQILQSYRGSLWYFDTHQRSLQNKHPRVI